MEYKAELEQEGNIVASVSGANKEAVIKEIQHYAMIYGQDGKVKIIYKWKRQ